MAGYDPRLTGLRGVASGGVAVYHALQSWGIPASLGIGAYLFGYYWSPSIINGALGVAVFLCLSIFLLMRSLDSNPDLGHYFKRRVLRIWPLYFFTCFVVFALFDHSPYHLVMNLAFVGTFVPGAMFHVSGTFATGYVLWTLQIEEFAYLTFPLIHKMLPRNQIRLGIVLIAFSVVWEAGMYGINTYQSNLPWIIQNTYTLPMQWVCCYGIGLLAYRGWRPRGVWTYAAIGAALCAVFLPAAVGPFEVILWLPVFAIVLVNPPKLLGNFLIVVVGEISYSLYLIHVAIIRVFGVLAAIPAAILASFAMESSVRWKEMRKRFVMVWTQSFNYA